MNLVARKIVKPVTRHQRLERINASRKRLLRTVATIFEEAPTFVLDAQEILAGGGAAQRTEQALTALFQRPRGVGLLDRQLGACGHAGGFSSQGISRWAV